MLSTGLSGISFTPPGVGEKERDLESELPKEALSAVRGGADTERFKGVSSTPSRVEETRKN